MRAVPHDDRRATQRNAADAHATIERHGRAGLPARLADVSAGGAMLEMAEPLDRGEEVTLVARGLELIATVAWVTPGHCGLTFHRRLQLGEVALLARRSRRALVANS